MVEGKRTPKRQAIRKIEGNMAEDIIRKKIHEILPPHYKSSVNRNQGIDLYLTNGETLNVEVKSAKEKTLYKNKKGIYKKKTGRFLIKKEDYIHADFFGFLVKKVDDKAKWTREYETKFVDAKIIKKYANDRNLTGKQLKISVLQINKMPSMNLKRRYK